jgi:hypothetical protein
MLDQYSNPDPEYIPGPGSLRRKIADPAVPVLQQCKYCKVLAKSKQNLFYNLLHTVL